MITLEKLDCDQRLFTYKVAHDGGSAPNAFHGICTLAICKPAIRRVARLGDVIVGLDCGTESSRIVYCMLVEGSLPWSDYIGICRGTAPAPAVRVDASGFRKKIPNGARDTGDCIWPRHSEYVAALDSRSGHDGPDDFARDVLDGKNVLFSTTFWYFGGGDKHRIHLLGDLAAVIPGRGHRSNGNTPFRDRFVEFFNAELLTRGIATPGKWGQPKLLPEEDQEPVRSRCRAAEREFDLHGEEL